MKDHSVLKRKKAQTALEYILLLMTVVAIVLVGLKTYLPRFQEGSNLYFNRVGVGIYGEPSGCGDGNCLAPPFEDCAKCPLDCGKCTTIP